MDPSEIDLRHELEERLRFETLLSDISTRFINLPADQIDSGIEEAQRRVCDCLGLDLSSLWQWTPESQEYLTLTHLHNTMEIPAFPGHINVEEWFPWQYEKMLQGETLAFSTEDLPPEAAKDLETRRRLGIKSSVSIPLSAGGGTIIGILTFSTLQDARTWPSEIVRQLKLVAQIVSNALARKKSQEILRLNEARLLAAVDAAGLGFYEMGVGLQIRFLDDRMRSLLGITPADEEHGREFWLSRIHPADRQLIQEKSRQVLTGGVERFKGEYRYLHPEHGVIWLHHLSRVIERDDAGNAVLVVGVMQDVTERKQKEEMLKEREAALSNSQKDLQKLAGRLISTQEDELRRLSRELHDDLTQRLAVLAIETGKLETQSHMMAPAFPDQFIQKISRIKEQLIKVSEDVHRISRQLHPTILDDLGLVKAVESECSMLQQKDNLETMFRHENVPGRMPQEVSLCIYRIIQEGMQNIVRHSGETRCDIFLKAADNSLRLILRDEGRGFDPVEVRKKPGLGLSSMRERVQLVRGEFSIDSHPGQGTVIRVSVPLNRSKP